MKIGGFGKAGWSRVERVRSWWNYVYNTNRSSPHTPAPSLGLSEVFICVSEDKREIIKHLIKSLYDSLHNLFLDAVHK